jgi:hypothetical protein
MKHYTAPDVTALADVARRQYRDGAAVITLGSVRVHRDAVIVTADGDTVHAVLAFLTASDVLGLDVTARAVEDATAYGIPTADAIADVYRDAVDGFDVVENVDGSAHAVTATARRVTDVTAVTIRHADGTTETVRQTTADADAVVIAGHRRLLTAIENGAHGDYADDIDADTVGELAKFAK